MSFITSILQNPIAQAAADYCNIFLAVIVAIYTVRVNKAEKRHEKFLENEAKKKNTLDAYSSLYLNALIPLEDKGTANEIKEDIASIKEEANQSRVKNFEAQPRAKEYKHIIMQIDVFAKGMKDNRLYDWDTFDTIANPDFFNNMPDRIKAYYDATSRNMSEELKSLLDQCEKAKAKRFPAKQ